MTETMIHAEENLVSTYDRFNLISNEIENHEFQVGETGHILSNKWYSRFKRSAKDNKNKNFNLPIDNSHLFSDDKEIKQWVVEGPDYRVISDKAWNLLSKWYKISGPSKEILTVKDPLKQKPVLDKIISFMINYLEPESNDEKISSKQVFISQYATIAELKHKALIECGLFKETDPETDSRLRDYFNQNSRQVLDDNRTILSYDFTFEPDLLLEKKKENGMWSQLKLPRHISSRKNSQSNNGKIGIKNVGNTCYQSAIFQALGHCRPLLDVTSNEKYNNYTNVNSILSLFCYYMRQMWDNETQGTPLIFKQTIYKDIEQHDAHEYLMVLINRLVGETNPDPNLSETKIPNLESSDGKPQKDNECFKKNWDALINLNQTPLFSMFYFLLSKRFQCLECNDVTNVFVSEPIYEIPFDTLNKKQQLIIWIPYASNNHPLKFVIKNENENVKDEEFKKKINDVLKQNHVEFENNANSTIAFAYSQNAIQTENTPTSPMFNPNLISGSSSTQILHFKPNFVFTNAKIVPDSLFAFEIPDKQKSYFLVNFPMPSFGQTLITTFICQFEEEESEEEAKRIAVKHLKKYLFGSLFKDDSTSDLEKSIFISVTVSGSLVQDDRYQFLYKLIVTVQLNMNDKINIKPRQLEEITKLPDCDVTDLLKEQLLSRIFDAPKRCEKCQKETKFTVSNHFWVLPDVFVIHIAPYKQTHNTNQRIPIKITFPEILDTSDLLEIAPKENVKYKLFSVVVYQPFHFEGGHYTAYAYHDKRKEWILFNDELVTDAKLSDVLQADPFLLFYQRIHDE